MQGTISQKSNGVFILATSEQGNVPKLPHIYLLISYIFLYAVLTAIVKLTGYTLVSSPVAAEQWAEHGTCMA